jgi:hypothetical protein
MSWINKIKQLLNGFLSSQDDKYITTEDGLKLWITDLNWTNKSKN